MKKLTLTEWAAIGEIVATIGVIVSLAFLTYSIGQSNKITKALNDNQLYDLQDSLYGGLIDNPDLVQIQVKLANGEELTEFENWRYLWHLWRFVNMWEVAFDRHADGLLSDEKWKSWNSSFEQEITVNVTGMSLELWESGRDTYGESFRNHVDAVYARQ